jgi:hypothetical protein
MAAVVVAALAPLFPIEVPDFILPGLLTIPFCSSNSFCRAFRSAHQAVIDWLRFSLFTRGFPFLPDGVFPESSLRLY